MSEAFVGDNNRALQGANLEFKAELYPILREVSADVFGARLAAAGNGESGVTPPGSSNIQDGAYWDKPYDKYLVGVNLGTQIVDGAGLGLSIISIFDDIDSYRPGPNSKAQGRASADSINAKLDSRATNIFAGRANVDTRVFMPDDFINVGLNLEAALSSDKRPKINPDDPKDVLDSAANGVVINAGLTARVAIGEENTLKLSADLIYNDTAFKNDAAQSPSFVQRAIMNNENALEGLGLLNPFDALYRSVFKYTPSQYFGGSKPYTKNAYVNAVLDSSQMAYVRSASTYVYPSIFQAALPGGMATADRIGPVVKFNGSFLDEGITVGVKAAMLTTYAEYEGIDKPQFQEIVAGAGLNIAKFAPAVGQSLQIGGSLGMYNVIESGNETKNNLLSFGIDYNFVPRFSILIGYQLLTNASTVPPVVSTSSGGDIIQYNYDFSNVAFGLSYKVADGGILTAKVSMLSGVTKDGVIFKPDEMGGEPVRDTFNRNYTALQPEVYLTVKF